MKSAAKPIFVSCSLGRDRTGMVVALYRMKRGEMSFNEVWQEGVYYGYRPRFRELRNALDRYQVSLATSFGPFRRFILAHLGMLLLFEGGGVWTAAPGTIAVAVAVGMFYKSGCQ